MNKIVQGWSIKKEVSAGTILTALLLSAGAITWGLQLEGKTNEIAKLYGVHENLEAHKGQRAVSLELIAEQRAIRAELESLKEVNTEIRTELRDLRLFFLQDTRGKGGK